MSYNGKALAEQIDTIVANTKDRIIETRRHFHQYPEVGWKELKTSGYLIDLLAGQGIAARNGLCGTSVIAEINGSAPGKTIAVRADMDGLPITDSKGVSYASRIPGVMHACGHDCHMAMALGVANTISQLKLDFPGRVKFIFQPCEESTPSGASELVKAGALDDIDAVLAFHVDPEIPAGKIGLRSGVLTAYCNEFIITLTGRTGHAARPHQAVDTIHMMSRVLTSLYDIVGNRSNPFVPGVVTIGKIDAGTKANVIADKVTIRGTIRTVDETSRKEILERTEGIVESISHSMGGGYQLEFLEPIPAVNNNHALINLSRELGLSMLGKENIVPIKDVSMGGEDFAWYLSKAPGALIRLGTARAGRAVTPLHTNTFDIDETALPLGVGLMTRVVLKYLLEDNLAFN